MLFIINWWNQNIEYLLTCLVSRTAPSSAWSEPTVVSPTSECMGSYCCCWASPLWDKSTKTICSSLNISYLYLIYLIWCNVLSAHSKCIWLWFNWKMPFNEISSFRIVLIIAYSHIVIRDVWSEIVTNLLLSMTKQRNQNTDEITMTTIHYPEHPLHPQWMHSTIRPSSSLLLGTLQIQLVAKLVSLVWIHRRQHRFSYPCFFHLAIKLPSAIFSWN